MNNILGENITKFKFNKKSIGFMEENQINTLFDLCQYSRMELSEKGLGNNQINDVIVKLQLLGLDLKPNHAKKNCLLSNNGY